MRPPNKPLLDARALIEDLEDQITQAINNRDIKDEECLRREATHNTAAPAR